MKVEKPSFAIFIVSGGVGASGEQLVQTVLAQFPQSEVKVQLVANVRQMEQIEGALRSAQACQGIVVHTLVDAGLRAGLIQAAQRLGVIEIDLMGPLLDHLSEALGEKPVEQPGLYRKLNQSYFERVAAIEYTLAHDDGKHPEGWRQADALILGVSRTGKTPLSLYLSMLGWRIANFPLVPEIPLPAALDEVDNRRVIGLDIDAAQLQQHRMKRQRQLGAPGQSAYADLAAIYEELEEARRIFRRRGFWVINVTDKPIESCADEVIRLLSMAARDVSR